MDVLQPLMTAAQVRHNTIDGPERERVNEALTAARAALDAATVTFEGADDALVAETNEPRAQG